MLDTLCLTGEVGWARLSAPARDATQMVGATPIALFLREHADDVVSRCKGGATGDDSAADTRTDDAALVLDALRPRGASFVSDLMARPVWTTRRSARRSPISSPAAWSRPTASAVCEQSCVRRAGGGCADAKPCRGTLVAAPGSQG